MMQRFWSWLAVNLGKRAGLVGIAAGSEGEAQDDEGDEQVQHPAGREPGAGGVFERLAVGRPVDHTVY